MPLKRKRQKMFDSVTERIKNQTQGGLKINPETGVRYEEPLEEKHPGLTVGIMAAQPGTILEKVLAPSVYKGMAKSIGEGNLSEALLASVAPVKGVSLTRVPESAWAEMLNEEAIAEAGALKNGTLGSSKFRPMPSKPVTEAEKLGIPKALRSNPKALEDPYYWGYQQWNQRYNAAVNSGNFEEAQRLRDLHFKIKAPDTKIVDSNGMPLHMYHGVADRGPRHFQQYRGVNWDVERAVKKGDLRNHWKIAEPTEDVMANYHTPDYKTALGSYGSGKKDLVHDDYLYIKKPFTYDEEVLHNLINSKFPGYSKKILHVTPEHYSRKPLKGPDGVYLRDTNGKIVWGEELSPERQYFEYPSVPDWSRFNGPSREILMQQGYDGLFIPQYYDSYGVFVSPAQFKSAEPITWNGKGEIIPIVKRDNFHNLDRRYKQGGKLKRK